MLACLTGYSFEIEDFIDRVAIIESNNNPNAIGDNGNAIGAYQMHKDAFLDAMAWLRVKHKLTYELLVLQKMLKDHKRSCLDPLTARLLATAYVELIIDRLKEDKQKVTPMAVYMCYNMGYSGAKRHSFNVNEITSHPTRINMKRAKAVLDTPPSR
jgi:hypothetical protein